MWLLVLRLSGQQRTANKCNVLVWSAASNANIIPLQQMKVEIECLITQTLTPVDLLHAQSLIVSSLDCMVVNLGLRSGPWLTHQEAVCEVSSGCGHVSCSLCFQPSSPQSQQILMPMYCKLIKSQTLELVGMRAGHSPMKLLSYCPRPVLVLCSLSPCRSCWKEGKVRNDKQFNRVTGNLCLLQSTGGLS